ncbi:MAG: antibiotic biosynthesis monooxygenase [Pseudomonadales bacterium]
MPSVTALVEYQIRTETCDEQQWLDIWGDRARDAWDSEPETLAYEACLTTEDASRVLVFERYADGQSSIDTHIQRSAHADLLSTMADRNMTKRRIMSNLFTDLDGYGWWGRPEQTATGIQAGLAMTVFGTRFRSAAMLKDYLALTGEHADYCREAEPGTLIYSAGVALHDADRGPDIKAGDLLFVAAFADQAAVLAHRDDARHVALQTRLQAIERERTFLQTFRSSGKGFLWR